MSIRSHAGLRPRIAVGVYVDPDAVVIGDVEIGAGIMVRDAGSKVMGDFL